MSLWHGAVIACVYGAWVAVCGRGFFAVDDPGSTKGSRRGVGAWIRERRRGTVAVRQRCRGYRCVVAVLPSSAKCANARGDFARGSPGDAATGASEPTWPTVQGQTVVDDVVTWSCLGESITTWSSASPTWAAATFTATNYAIYDAQSGVGSTEPVLVLGALSPSLTPVAGTATVTTPALGWAWTTPS